MGNEENVAVTVTNKFKYPNPPFNPGDYFPEFKNFKLIKFDKDKDNEVYGMVRESLHLLGLDKKNWNTIKWNPMKDLVTKGNKVVIKPNLVKADHPLGDKGIECTITNASVIRPIIDYLLLATEGDIDITIADVPLQSSNWNQLIEKSGLADLVSFYKLKRIKIKLLDLRYEIAFRNKAGVVDKRDTKIRDPLGYSEVDLKDESELMDIIEYNEKLEITDYPSTVIAGHHNKERNEYLICNTILNADLFINVPKLKTHRKAGMTFALKNLIGINGDKSWIAHHRRGSKSRGGDEYEKFDLYYWFRWHLFKFLKKSKFGILIASFIKKFYEKFIWKGSKMDEVKMKGEKTPSMEGSWYGNDTLWRCILDLNKIIFYSDKEGHLRETPQRKYLCIGDAIISGEKEGPMENMPKKSGLIIAGFNPVSVDFVASKLMGFDWKKIPQISNAFKIKKFNLTTIKPSNIKIQSKSNDVENINLQFEPTINWKGNIER